MNNNEHFETKFLMVFIQLTMLPQQMFYNRRAMSQLEHINSMLKVGGKKKRNPRTMIYEKILQ